MSDVISYLKEIPSGTVVYIMSPLQIFSGRTPAEQLEILKQQGFSRIIYNKELKEIDEVLAGKVSKNADIYILIDRFKSALRSLMTKDPHLWCMLFI